MDLSAAATLDTDYGAGFWTNRSEHERAKGRVMMGIPRDAFFAFGDQGQRIVILQSQQMVIVRLGDSVDPTGDMRGLQILLPRADIGRELLAEGLRKQGAEVAEVVAYRTLVAEPQREGEPDIYRMLLERRIDVVTFTSASAVRHFVDVLGPEPAADLLRTTVVASIGPVTAEAAAQYNIQTKVVPAQSTIPALVDAIVDYFAKQKEEATV